MGWYSPPIIFLIRYMNIKHLTLALFCLCIASFVHAQEVDFSKYRGHVKADSIAKQILEQAQYVVAYDYKFVRNAKYPNAKRSGLTILQIGQRYNRFCDYYSLRFDSLYDVAALGKFSFAESAPQLLAVLKKVQFTENIVIDKESNKETIQRTAGLATTKYEYQEVCPQLQWQLLEGDTTIAGYPCKKAATQLFGRQYVAWYAPSLDLPYGPYKFGGLPGLVLQVADTQQHFLFTISGLQKVTGYTPIYLWANKAIVKSNRQKVRQIYKNYCADPAAALNSMEGVEISQETKARINAKPYNPIELE